MKYLEICAISKCSQMLKAICFAPASEFTIHYSSDLSWNLLSIPDSKIFESHDDSPEPFNLYYSNEFLLLEGFSTAYGKLL